MTKQNEEAHDEVHESSNRAYSAISGILIDDVIKMTKVHVIPCKVQLGLMCDRYLAGCYYPKQ